MRLRSSRRYCFIACGMCAAQLWRPAVVRVDFVRAQKHSTELSRWRVVMRLAAFRIDASKLAYRHTICKQIQAQNRVMDPNRVAERVWDK